MAVNENGYTLTGMVTATTFTAHAIAPENNPDDVRGGQRLIDVDNILYTHRTYPVVPTQKTSVLPP